MSLPFDAKRVQEYAVEFGAGGQRLGCEFRLQDSSVLFINDSQITPEASSSFPALAHRPLHHDTAWKTRPSQ